MVLKEIAIVGIVIGVVILSHAVAFGKFGTTLQKAHLKSITEVAINVPNITKIGQK